MGVYDEWWWVEKECRQDIQVSSKTRGTRIDKGKHEKSKQDSQIETRNQKSDGTFSSSWGESFFVLPLDIHSHSLSPFISLVLIPAGHCFSLTAPLLLRTSSVLAIRARSVVNVMRYDPVLHTRLAEPLSCWHCAQRRVKAGEMIRRFAL